jgi:cell division septum initiation protein DivIVA
MPETAATRLASQYISQVTGDLEQNLKEQERISAEIASLRKQLAALQHDHDVLQSMQQALGIARPRTDSVSGTVP